MKRKPLVKIHPVLHDFIYLVSLVDKNRTVYSIIFGELLMDSDVNVTEAYKLILPINTFSNWFYTENHLSNNMTYDNVNWEIVESK